MPVPTGHERYRHLSLILQPRQELSADLQEGRGGFVRLSWRRWEEVVAQVVGVTGTNPTGKRIVASELHRFAPASQAASTPQQLEAFARRTGGFLDTPTSCSQLSSRCATMLPATACTWLEISRCSIMTSAVRLLLTSIPVSVHSSEGGSTLCSPHSKVHLFGVTQTCFAQGKMRSDWALQLSSQTCEACPLQV